MCRRPPVPALIDCGDGDFNGLVEAGVRDDADRPHARSVVVRNGAAALGTRTHRGAVQLYRLPSGNSLHVANCLIVLPSRACTSSVVNRLFRDCGVLPSPVCARRRADVHVDMSRRDFVI
jgi:hypothetical protein